MGTQIHYELFKRVGAKGDCTMHDVLPSRERAIETAQELMKDEKATVVKVVKETYNDDTGDYLSLKIFEDGHNQVKVDPKAEDAPHALIDREIEQGFPHLPSGCAVQLERVAQQQVLRNVRESIRLLRPRMVASLRDLGAYLRRPPTLEEAL